MSAALALIQGKLVFSARQLQEGRSGLFAFIFSLETESCVSQGGRDLTM